MSEKPKYTVDKAERVMNHLLSKKESRIMKFIQKGNRITEQEKEYVNDERKLIDVVKYLVYEYKNLNLGKLSPQALDLEVKVLGAVILESKNPEVVKVLSILRPDHFYSEIHQYIYKAIVDMNNKRYPIDMHTVVGQLRKQGKIDDIGGAYYIAQLTAYVSSAANVEYHARIIIEYAIKRYLISVAQRIMIEAYDDTVDVFELLDAIKERIRLIESENVQPVTVQ